jgi:hypothetical protein
MIFYLENQILIIFQNKTLDNLHKLFLIFKIFRNNKTFKHLMLKYKKNKSKSKIKDNKFHKYNIQLKLLKKV